MLGCIGLCPMSMLGCVDRTVSSNQGIHPGSDLSIDILQKRCKVQSSLQIEVQIFGFVFHLGKVVE